MNNNKNTAIFACSADPITNGHLDIINRSCNTFDKVIVGIGINPSKKYTFSVEERIKFVQQTVKYPFQVEVMSFDGLLSDFAYEQHVKVIVKGVRTQQDFDYERMLHEVIITQQAGIDTHILIADQRLSHISSSAAKEICRYQGLIHEYVPMCVKHALERKINNQEIIGITGSIGMGKSYVTNQLIDYYTPTNTKITQIDLDKLAHEIYDRPEPVYVNVRNEISKLFNLNPLDTKDGRRKKLGDIVFNDESALNQLNDMLRIPILTLLRSKLFKLEGVILLNGALLAEADFLSICNNNIIVVESNKDDQIKHLEGRGLTPHQIQRRIYSQFSNSKKIETVNQAISKHSYGTCIPYVNSKINNDAAFGELIYKFNKLLKH